MPAEDPGRSEALLSSLGAGNAGLGVCELLSHVRLFVTPWTVACQSPLSMEFSRQEYWSG